MRLALLGEVGEHRDSVKRVCEFALNELFAEHVVYLGVDDALDSVIASWAEEIVGGDASELGIQRRAAERCAQADAAEIDEFVHRERERERLRVFESLPGDNARTVEMLGGRMAVMIFDKAQLDEEDILPASLLLFGKSPGPVVKQVGQRWFISPGSFDEGGLCLLDDADQSIQLQIFDRECEELRTERLATPRVAKLKVSGG